MQYRSNRDWMPLAFSFMFLVNVLAPLKCFAMPVMTGAGAPTHVHHTHSAANLDLSSTVQSAHASRLTGHTPININVGGVMQNISPSSSVTPAERAAVFQVLSSGHQSLVLGALGNAIGGTLQIGSHLSQNISSLVIPQGVTVIDNISRMASATVNIAGSLMNGGNLYVVSNNSSVTSATVNASSIINQPGALLTSVLPPGGLPGFSNAISSLHLSLNAVNNIVNHGVISSSGNLNLRAGGSISNSGTLQGAQNTSLVSAAGTITNAGLISAGAGNLNINSAMSQSLVLNNAGGTLQALNGAINFSTATADQLGSAPNLAVNGGNLIAKELNLNSVGGDVDFNVDIVQGQVNVSACNAHIVASTPDLVLGNLQITGDPIFWNAGGSVTIPASMNFENQNLSIVASQDIVTGSTGSGGGVIDVSSSSFNAGSVLMVAGAQFVTPASGSGSNDGTTVVTISGASSTGGKIDLTGGNSYPITGINASATSGSGGDGGSVTLVAFYGTSSHTATPGSGTITLPTTSTITTGTTTNSSTTLNGNVFVIAGAPTGQSITLGSINTSGNTINPQSANNGMVLIASATPTLWGNIGGASTPLQLVGGASFTATSIAVSTPVQALTAWLNPLGANAEMITSTNTSASTTVNLQTPLVNNHTTAEALYVPADSLVIYPVGIVGSVVGGLPNTSTTTPPPNPTTINGGIILPGTVQSGNISVGSVTANNAITISTNPSATTGNGTVTLSGSMSLTMNVTTQTSPIVQYQSFPTISITGTAVTVNSGVTISSGGSGTTYANAPDSINIVTQTLNNNGTITGGNPTDNPFSNAYINVSSPSTLKVQGSGTFSVPQYSVIEVAAADGSVLTLGSQANSLPTFTTGTGGLVIFNAQANGGGIDLVSNQTLTVAGGPIISVNTPVMVFESGSSLSATGPSQIAFGSGYAPSTLNVVVHGTPTVSTSSGGSIGFRAADGRNLNFQAGTGSQLTLRGAQAVLATSGGGTIRGLSALSSGSHYITSTSPNGGMLGVEFQTYVGPYFNGPYSTTATSPEFVNFAGYPFQVVLALLGPVAAQQQFQVLSTYTQQFSSSYVIGAAKQLGLRVSAGVFLDIAGNGQNSNTAVTNSDIQLALMGAAKYGNVTDIVVGNEDIVATSASNPDPTPSVNTLISTIQQVQTARGNYTDPVTGAAFTKQTLPVTTRQEIGVLTGDVTTYPSMQTLIKTVDSYIYGNAYPFFNESTVVPYLVQHPDLTQSQFTSLVDTNMTGQYSAAATAIKGVTMPMGQSTPDLRIGETGWATELLSNTSNPGIGYMGSSLPQQSTTWAGWYYQAMQGWSATTTDIITNTKGVTISGYFGLYNEPWKGIDGAAPGGNPASMLAAMKGATQIITCCFGAGSFPTLTPMSVLVDPNNGLEEVQNISKISGSTLTVSALVNAHANGATVDAGHPEEPFFGLYAAQGTFPTDSALPTSAGDSGNGYVFTLTGISSKYTLPIYTPTHQQAVEFTPLTRGTTQNLLTGITNNSSNGSNQVNEQIGTRISTDNTPVNDNSEGMSTSKPFNISSGSPYNVTGSGGGWKSSANGSIWSCSGCLGTGGRGEGALRLIQKLAEVNDGDRTNASSPPRARTSSRSSLIAQANSQPALPPAQNAASDSDERNFELSRGVALVNAQDEIVVGTQEGKVHIEKGSLAFVIETGHDVCVYNLHDLRTGGINVMVGNRLVNIPPCKQLVLTRKGDAKFDEVNPGKKIGYRNAQSLSLNGNVKGFMADFSIPSAIATIPPLKDMLRSKKPADRRVATQLLKNAVITAQLTGSAGAYTTSSQ